ncbi:MAG: putative lipoprotein, partial [uncultured Rubrobacteraceae bacterium]
QDAPRPPVRDRDRHEQTADPADRERRGGPPRRRLRRPGGEAHEVRPPRARRGDPVRRLQALLHPGRPAPLAPGSPPARPGPGGRHVPV